jgi:antitoxin CcdA
MLMNIRNPSGGQKDAIRRSVRRKLSATIDDASAGERARKWLAENKDAIEVCNRDVEKRGVWSDGLRRW